MRPGVRPGRRLGRGAATLGALVAGFVGGAVLTMALSSPATPTLPGEAAGIPPPGDGVAVPVAPAEPETFLAWVPGGMPGSFSEALDDVAGIRRAVTVRSGVGWVTASWSADGELVDRPPAGLAIPLEVAAVPPGRYAPFLPPAERSVVGALADGEGVLGTMSAELRGLGPGAVLAFGDLRIRIAAVLPDELVGAHELMVSTRTGLALGIRLERYALLQPTPRARLDLEARLAAVLPEGRLLRVRAPGETPFFRHGDAVLPQVRVKQLFGEFAARPDGGFLDVDPAWVREHIVVEHVPLLGRVRCNRALFPQLRGALREAAREGLAHAVKAGQFAGCYNARFLNRIPEAGLSHHSWGIALDVNVADNPYGAPPDQNPRLVEIMEGWGFHWGGHWLVPDGMHFEFGRFP